MPFKVSGHNDKKEKRRYNYYKKILPGFSPGSIESPIFVFFLID
jgi:hypothetical protein